MGDSFEGSKIPAREVAVARQAGASDELGSDRLAYMADLLAELTIMARVEGHTTLEGLLALAHAEALQRRR